MAELASCPSLTPRHPRFSLPSPAPGRRAPLLALVTAIQLSCHAGPALSLETLWTGQAGAAQPFWDLASNWSAGLPASADTDVQLASSDTTLRSGSFVARSVRGTGALSMKGGQLDLHAGASSLGRLELSGGRIVGHQAALRVGSLRWTAGQVGVASSPEDSGMNFTVEGPAVLQGASLSFGGAVLRLEGLTSWKDGASTLALAHLATGPRGVFHDDARTADHRMGASILEGRYVKTGAATTTVGSGYDAFENRGLLEVLGGTWEQHNFPNGTWSNTGRIRVQDAEMKVSTFRSPIGQHGIVDVLSNAKITLRHDRAWLGSTGLWNIAEGGTVEVSNDDPYEGEALFLRGAVNNAGTLRFSQGRARVSKEVEWHGPGTIEAARGARLTIEGDLDVGGLRIGEPDNRGESPPYYNAVYSRVELHGRATLDRLEWGEAWLDTSGPLTVRGQAELYDRLEYWAGPMRPPVKEIKTAFSFLGPTRWDGNADLQGSGSIHIGSGGRFEDHNSRGTRDAGDRPARPTRVAVASVLNEGSYLKTGAGQTTVVSSFVNRGSVRSVAAGTLTFAGRLDNTGTMEADRSRVVIWGPLAQYREGELRAGRYIARNGSLVFNLGDAAYGFGPALIQQNRATIVLDGPEARFVTVWRGVEQNALSSWVGNEGQLSLLGGATLQTLSLTNYGRLEIGAGSVLQADMFWQAMTQEPTPEAATWLAGILDVREVHFEHGRLSAGLEGQVGDASLLGESVSLAGSRLLLDVAAAEVYDRLRISGSVELNGTLRAEFVDAAAAPGSYRFLTAGGGVSGTFSSLASNLDPALYHLSARYGTHHVDLVVSSVPEPGSWMLTGIGAAALAGRARRRRAAQAEPA
ncbi:PEP-CTERM sorting domain-containing protein [Aquabacterium sp. A7-Y]|uniref:PEP-CTERM sorting domain-containing protein n=1 Tax=Aquabacterium sp. A7-Y TaxID=1349605 RepID=UPI00223D2E13|nr:PEP-CTERM sorting domain-containing protein [Aquabacterium sp. A7-Y]MCW7538307.1 PEP-CTERM sorting domain-containing protein [Aquabacterium sp. A7-Y]